MIPLRTVKYMVMITLPQVYHQTCINNFPETASFGPPAGFPDLECEDLRPDTCCIGRQSTMFPLFLHLRHCMVFPGVYDTIRPSWSLTALLWVDLVCSVLLI